jgi:hypothetical protein
MFAASQQTNRDYLKDLKPYVFQEYLNYLLGEHCIGLVSGGSVGAAVSTQTWDLVLAYEQEIRFEMTSKIMKGASLESALRAAWADPVVKERYFTTPLALAHLKRARPDVPAGVDEVPPPTRRQATETAREEGCPAG